MTRSGGGCGLPKAARRDGKGSGRFWLSLLTRDLAAATGGSGHGKRGCPGDGRARGPAGVV